MNLQKKVLEVLKSVLDERNQKEKMEELVIGNIFNRASAQKRYGKRHRPYTKPPLTGESKKRRKMAKESRRINRH